MKHEAEEIKVFYFLSASESPALQYAAICYLSCRTHPGTHLTRTNTAMIRCRNQAAIVFLSPLLVSFHSSLSPCFSSSPSVHLQSKSSSHLHSWKLSSKQPWQECKLDATEHSRLCQSKHLWPWKWTIFQYPSSFRFLSFHPTPSTICSELQLRLIYSAAHTHADTQICPIKAQEQLAFPIWMAACLSTSLT